MATLFLVVLFLFTNGALCSTSKLCQRVSAVPDQLKAAGIASADIAKYLAIFEQNKIDDAVLPHMTMAQLQSAGIQAMGDRIKIYQLYASDRDDCTQHTCKNGGHCVDAYKCFRCSCDGTGYYGQTCQNKCPCKNGGHCVNKVDGFTCICSPGFNGKLCENIWLTEEKFSALESQIKQLKSQVQKAKATIKKHEKDLEVAQAKFNATGFSLTRVNEVFNNLAKLSLHQSTPTLIQALPMVLPRDTKAIIVSVFFFYKGAANKHGYMDFDIYQRGNQGKGKASLRNTHYDVHWNTFYYEVLLPWNTALTQELVVKVTSSFNTAVGQNWYEMKLVGYMTA